MVERGLRRAPVVPYADQRWTYRELLDTANRIARVLREDLGLVPGNRVLLRGPNNPMLAACWFGVLKAGGIVVTHHAAAARARARGTSSTRREIALALCDARLADELERRAPARRCAERICCFDGSGLHGAGAELERRMRRQAARVRQRRHRGRRHRADRLHLGHHRQGQGHDALPPRRAGDLRLLPALRAASPRADDIFCGSPPLAFTFGLGGLVLFPMRVGASAVLLERPRPTACSRASRSTRPTRLLHRADRLPRDARAWPPSTTSRACASASRPARRCRCHVRGLAAATGLRIIDGIGATEMLHIFISRRGDDIRPGSTGRPSPATRRAWSTTTMRPLPPGEVGRLAVRGPTGCRYLADERQRDYVQRRLEPHRRRLPDGRGRLLLVPGAHRRHDHLGRLQHRRARGRERAARARRGRGVRAWSACRTRSAARSSRRSSCCARRSAGASAARQGAAGVREGSDRAVQVSARDRVRRRPAAHRDRQAAALPAAPEEAASARPRRSAERADAVLQPPGWPRPRGYANGIAAEGRLVFVAGQIGWDASGTDGRRRLRRAGRRRRSRTRSPCCARRAPAPRARRAHDLVHHRQARTTSRAPARSARPIAR